VTVVSVVCCKVGVDGRDALVVEAADVVMIECVMGEEPAILIAVTPTS